MKILMALMKACVIQEKVLVSVMKSLKKCLTFFDNEAALGRIACKAKEIYLSCAKLDPQLDQK